MTNAHRIVSGEMPDLSDRKNDFFFMRSDNEDDTVKTVTELIKTRLPRTYGYSPTEDIQVLTPTRIGTAGTKELNRVLQLALNPPANTKKELRHFDTAFRMGDKVMQIKNDYDVAWKKGGESGTGIFNGDIGMIYDVDTRSGTLSIDFDGRKALYTSEMLSKLEHAYAVTIHKSQGSEYKAVIMPLSSAAPQLLYRNLLYTGVTRAKEILILVGSGSVVSRMVENDRRTLRYTCVKEMLSEKYGAQTITHEQ